MSNKETEILGLIDKISAQVSESKKRLSDLKTKFLNEETVLIGLTLQLDELRELLRRYRGSVTLNEVEVKNNQIDEDFRAKLETLLTSVK